MAIKFPSKWAKAWQEVYKKKCTSDDVSKGATWGDFSAQKIYVNLKPYDAFVVYISGEGIKSANAPDVQIPQGPMLSGSSLFAVYNKIMYTTTSTSFQIKILNWVKNSNYIAMPVILGPEAGKQGVWEILQVFFIKDGTLYVETYTKKETDEEWTSHGVMELGDFTPTTVRFGVDLINGDANATIFFGISEFTIYEVNQMAQMMQEMFQMMFQMMNMMMQMMLMMMMMRMMMAMMRSLTAGMSRMMGGF